jgi:hypothetical protein
VPWNAFSSDRVNEDSFKRDAGREGEGDSWRVETRESKVEAVRRIPTGVIDSRLSIFDSLA